MSQLYIKRTFDYATCLNADFYEENAVSFTLPESLFYGFFYSSPEITL